MRQNKIPEHLKASVSGLVNAAEKTIQYCQHQRDSKLEEMKTQASQLISVCLDANCAEEIENYIRYQIGRKRLARSLGEQILTNGKEAITSANLTSPDDKVWAWQRFATYLKRELVYAIS